jgi:hypothetical protein
MAASARKQQEPAPPSASDRLASAQAVLAETDHKLAELNARRNECLLKDDIAGAIDLGVQITNLKLTAEAHADRIAQLREKVAEEEQERQAQEREALIKRIEAKFEQRDKSLKQVAAAIEQLAVASERAMKLGREIAGLWSWQPHDLPPALLSPPSIMTAISHESFRVSYHARRYGGQDSDPLAGIMLPGSRAPTLQLLENPSGVRPMVDVVAVGTAFAKEFLRTGRGSASMNGVQQQQTVADSLEAPAPSGDAPVQHTTEATARLAFLLRQQATLAEDVSPQGEEAYARCVAEIVKAQAVVAAEQRVETQNG